MSRLLEKYKLEKRITKLEKLIKEAKQVGTLYHVCTLDAYINWIRPNDTLQASGKYTNWVYGGTDIVSFTRDKYFVVGTKSVQQSKVLVQLVIDGDLLSEHYKVGPYNDFAFDKEGGHVEETPSDDGSFQPQKYREKEECVRGPIKNLSKYIKEIRLDIFDMDSGAITKIRKAKLDGKNTKYYHFIKKYQQKAFTDWAKLNGIKDGMALDDVMPKFKEYVNLEKFNEMLFSYDEDEIAKAIKSKANLNAKYPAGYVLEEYVTDDDNVEIVSMLLKGGANPNIKLSSATAIALAAEYDNPNMINLLVENGAALDPAALVIASANGNKKAVQALLDAGADPNAANDKGNTPMAVAKSKQVASMLKKAGATV